MCLIVSDRPRTTPCSMPEVNAARAGQLLSSVGCLGGRFCLQRGAADSRLEAESENWTLKSRLEQAEQELHNSIATACQAKTATTRDRRSLRSNPTVEAVETVILPACPGFDEYRRWDGSRSTSSVHAGTRCSIRRSLAGPEIASCLSVTPDCSRFLPQIRFDTSGLAQRGVAAGVAVANRLVSVSTIIARLADLQPIMTTTGSFLYLIHSVPSATPPAPQAVGSYFLVVVIVAAAGARHRESIAVMAVVGGLLTCALAYGHRPFRRFLHLLVLNAGVVLAVLRPWPWPAGLALVGTQLLSGAGTKRIIIRRSCRPFSSSSPYSSSCI